MNDKEIELRVKRGCLVVMDYEVRLLSGKVVDSSQKTGAPARFVCGQGLFPKPVEEEIIGLKIGEKKIIEVHPKYTYGDYDPKKILLVAQERFSGELEIGKVAHVPDEFGIRRPAIVLKVWEGAVLVDFNHPLAGKPLKFEILIRDIQPGIEAGIEAISDSNSKEIQLAS